MVKSPFYYGWVILLATAITEMLAFGTTSYAAGFFVIPLQTELGLTRTAVSFAFPILFLGVTIVAPFVGKVLDRYPAPWVVSLGAVAMSTAFAVIAWTNSLLLMVLMLVFPAAIGFAAIGTLTTGTLLSRWFYRRRGLALGIGAVATSGGGIFVAPVINSLIESYGWRNTLLIEGGCILCSSVALAIFFIRDRPSNLGLENHLENENRPPQDGLSENGKSPRWRLDQILRNRNFWGAAIPLCMVSGICQAVVTIVPPYANQLGFEATAISRLIQLFAMAAGATKILSGLLADHINRRLILCCAGLIMMISAALFMALSTYLGLAIGTVLAGVALGCVLPSSAAVIAHGFGAPSFGTVMGWAYVLLGAAIISLPPLAGMIFDKTGSYHAAFAIFGALSALGAFSTMLLPRKILQPRAEG